MNAYVVVDLAFGDSGKGLLTDALVRRTGATTVVRYNGGAQAGHNVVTADGRHHTFAQVGAGSFVPGVRTILSRHVVIHPTALRVEAGVLAEQGMADILSRIRISDRAPVVTPFHQAAGRIRELSRGAARHGSCGIGVGEVVRDFLERPDETLYAGDFFDLSQVRRKVGVIRERKRAEMQGLPPPAAPEAHGLPDLPAHATDDSRWGAEFEVFERSAIVDDWIEQASSLAALGLVAPDAELGPLIAGEQAVVFEGAQGVLLDERHGFHPHTSWSDCTAGNAQKLLREWSPAARVLKIGVLRSHTPRHGPGPLPTETGVLGAATVFDHNRPNAWQGPVRYGWFDAVLARYALDVVGGVDALAVTHLDALQKMPAWKACRGYRAATAPDEARFALRSPADLLVTRLLHADRSPADGLPTDGSPTDRALAVQARLTEFLCRAVPVYEECPPREEPVLRSIETSLGRRVDIVSRGPRAADVVFTTPF